MKHTLLTILILVAFSSKIFSQSQSDKVFNPVVTSLNFLTISPDAKGSALGGTGAATAPDPFSVYWNPAKLSMVKDEYGGAIGYSPWLSKIDKGMGLASFTGYKKMGDEKSTIGLDIRYFSLGKILFQDEIGSDLFTYNPTEYTIGITYATQLSEFGGIGLTFRYIRSQPALGVEYRGQVVKSVNAIGADIGYYYHNVAISEQDGYYGNIYRFGAVLQNIGTKVSYLSNTRKTFQPMNLKIGMAYTFANDNNDNTFTIAADFNKLLVPTPPLLDSNGNISSGKDPDVGVPAAIFSSWGDAPGGFAEEIREITLGLGLEYSYRDQFFLRAGMLYENPSKGNQQLITAGCGFRAKNFNADMSYYAPFSSNPGNNAHAQTFKISIGINISPY